MCNIIMSSLTSKMLIEKGEGLTVIFNDNLIFKEYLYTYVGTITSVGNGNWDLRKITASIIINLAEFYS